MRGSSCQAVGRAGPRGFNRISNRTLSLTTVFLVSLSDVLLSPGSRVQVVGAVGSAGLRAAGDDRGLSYDWLCADGGP